MLSIPWRKTILALTPVLLSALHLLSHSQTALAYTSESAEVKAMVGKAMAFLEKAKHEQPGGMALVGMAFLKTGSKVTHPQVQEAVAQARDLARKAAQQGIGENCYNAAIACIFLCEAGPEEFAQDINALLNALLSRQQQNGCWGYHPHTYDDTSQTQYGMLALWTAHSAGIPAQTPRVERAMQWLFSVQTKDGGFPYKPGDPVSLSMSAAGLGSVYVGAHLLGFGVKSESAKEENKTSLPPAVQLSSAKRKKEEKEFQTLRPRTISAAMVRRVTSGGNAWFDKNFGTENSDERFTYYYLYGLERYKSFQEIVDGVPEAEPAWYNAGVDYLKAKQQKDGSWHKGMIGAAADTAFAVLFLIRGTKKSIKDAVVNEGVLVGGQGLPKNITNITMKDGQVTAPKMVREMGEWLEMVEGAEDKDFDPDAFTGMTLDDDLTERTSQLERLRKLVTNDDYKARRAAVKKLATARELDNVPILIYALTDTDPEVPIYARDGLRFISRKLKGFGMPDLVTKNGKVVPPTSDQKQAAAKEWKKWYLSIRPDGELLD